MAARFEEPLRKALINSETCTTIEQENLLRGKLRHVKVQLLSLLVELDRALGDEPSVKTRAERRGR